MKMYTFSCNTVQYLYNDLHNNYLHIFQFQTCNESTRSEDLLTLSQRFVRLFSTKSKQTYRNFRYLDEAEGQKSKNLCFREYDFLLADRKQRLTLRRLILYKCRVALYIGKIDLYN